MKAWRFAAALLLVAAVLAVYHWAIAVNAVTAALTLLLAILFISTMWGLAEATAACVAAVVGFNYFFLEPIGKLTIQDPQNIVVGEQLAHDAAASPGRAETDSAYVAGRITGAQKARAGPLTDRAKTALKAFADAKPFWK